MTSALLIGFRYTLKQIVGAIIDLYCAYSYCEKVCDKIYIFTDIESPKMPDNISRAITSDVVDGGVLNFLCEPEKYNITIIKGPDEIIEGIRRLPVNDRWIIYYTGHGKTNEILLPNQALLPIVTLKTELYQRCYNNSELFIIMDCCKANNLQLPFRLTGNAFGVASEVSPFIQQKVLLLIPTSPEGKAIASEFGSFFTRHLFAILKQLHMRNKQHKLTLSYIVAYINNAIPSTHNQVVQCYSSYMIPALLWGWIINLPIEYNITQNYLEVRRLRTQSLKI